MRKPGDITVIHRTLDVTESSSLRKPGDSPPAIAIIQAAIHIAAITTTAMRKVSPSRQLKIKAGPIIVDVWPPNSLVL